MQDALTPEEFIAYLTKNLDDRTNQSILYDYAVKLHKENKIAEAVSAYKAVISANSDNADAYVNLAICYASQNDYKNAESILKTAKNKFPSNNCFSFHLMPEYSNSFQELQYEPLPVLQFPW